MQQSKYRFRFVAGYAGETEYSVSGDGETYAITRRNSLPEYWRKICNGGDERWKRACVPTLNSICRHNWATRPLRDDVVDAFNAWHLAEHERALAHLLAHPEKYGEIGPDDRVRDVPNPVRGLVLDMDQIDVPGQRYPEFPFIGWRVTRDWPDRKPGLPFHVHHEYRNEWDRITWAYTFDDGRMEYGFASHKEATQAALQVIVPSALVAA